MLLNVFFVCMCVCTLKSQCNKHRLTRTDAMKSLDSMTERLHESACNVQLGTVLALNK